MKTENKPKRAPLRDLLPVVVPKLKPRNPVGKRRKSTVLHQDKRNKQKHKEQHDYT